MTGDDEQALEETVNALKALGFREYEAKCFVALSRLPSATAKTVSELTDIPRTRVYDAMEELSEKGLVEIHYSSPKRYRAVDHAVAVTWFRDQFESELTRFERSSQELDPFDPARMDSEPSVWSIEGLEAILIRMKNLIEHATDYVVVFVDDVDQFNTTVLEILETCEADSLIVLTPAGIESETVTTVFDTRHPTVLSVDIPLDQLDIDSQSEYPVTCVMIDGETVVVRTQSPPQQTSEPIEQAVVAEGRHNSIVRWCRLLFGV